MAAVKGTSSGKMSKPVEVRMSLIAEKATPAPPVGPALGQRGVNLVEFCKKFNSISAGRDSTMPLRLIVTVTPDKKFSIRILGHKTTDLIKKKLGIEKGASKPGSEVVSKISAADAESLLSDVMEASGARSRESAMNILIGTARSMGIKVEV